MLQSIKLLISLVKCTNCKFKLKLHFETSLSTSYDFFSFSNEICRNWNLLFKKNFSDINQIYLNEKNNFVQSQRDEKKEMEF